MSVQNIGDVENLLRGAPTARELHTIWESRQPILADPATRAYKSSASSAHIPWLEDVSLAQRFSAQALRQEEFLLVLDSAREILSTWDTASEDDRTRLVRVRMDYANALTRLGFISEARSTLEFCLKDGFRPELGRKLKADILLQLGHILQEDWHYAPARATQLKVGEDALSFYRRALQLDPERLDALVLTSATAFLLGEAGSDLRAEAQEQARHVLKQVKDLEDFDGPRHRTTWAEATAHAILGGVDDAARSFQKLQSMNDVTTANLAEARFHSRLLAEALGKPRDFFKAAFPPLQLIVFAGHLPDLPGGPVRLPPESIPAAREALRKELKQMGARVGLASACAGADLLFTDVLKELGGTLHLVLPWSRDEFARTSVRPFEPPSGPMWEPLFHQALETAATTREIGQVYEPSSDVGWEFMMEVTAGIALHTARALRLDIKPLVLWDERPGWGAGGTDSFYSFWSHRLDAKPIVIRPPAISAGAARDGSEHGVRTCERSILHQEVKSMLFADIVGYSKLTEKAIPDFIGTFLERLGQLAAASKHAPCNVNTWGDALYAVFDFAADAGLFALKLAQMLQEGEAEWLAKGLYWEDRSPKGEIVKKPLNIRIGLHTGPVVMHYDPVVRRLGFTGAHVNRAARIEPVAEPGQVFASEEFAAMAELSAELQRRTQGDPNSAPGLGFVCEYAGSRQLAKGYPGRHRIYRVVPKRVFPLESLAKAAHEAYCAESKARGDTPATNSSMRPWEELNEDLKEANRDQVADIPNKLRLLGFELAPSHGIRPSEIVISDAQVEELAIREHDRWMAERQRQGWTYGPRRDNARKLHPLLVPWARLSEPEKEKDRDTIRNLRDLVERAGFRVRRIS